MSRDTLRRAARRIADHARAWKLLQVRVVLHGGEPLLAGVDHVRGVLTDLTDIITATTRLSISIQTNGVLLDERFCDLFTEFGVAVGVSLDGDRHANDLHRRFRHGGSSYDHAVRALTLLRQQRYRRIYAGILCTVDVRNDPIAVYEALISHEPPRVDFLLPHATWDAPPLRPGGDPTAYASWLTAIYTRWRADAQPIRVRMFETLRSANGSGGSEQIGGGRADLLVVETDGTWEQADSLKIAYDGAAGLATSVFTHTVNDVSAKPEIARRQLGIDSLSPTCRACPVVGTCGGGMYAHRYSSHGGFDNPSVYCSDLQHLIAAISDPATVASAPQEGPRTGLIDDLGTGAGTEDSVRLLADTQLHITRALLAAVGDHLASNSPAGRAWHLLADLESKDPQAVSRVLAHPYLRPWARRYLLATATDPGYMASIAIAAAVATGVDAQLQVPTPDARLYLPGLGTIVLTQPAAGTAEVTVSAGSITIRHDGQVLTVPAVDQPLPHWQPTRRLSAIPDVILEDGDPYRGLTGWTPDERVSDDTGNRWAATSAAAYQAIQDDVPRYLAGLRAGLRAVVPLAGADDGRLRAHTARDAFGAVSTVLAPPATLAVMIIHEFQHSKLGALLDLYDLADPTSPLELNVGWRDDPRPIEGVLQGVYAHLAVTHAWRPRAEREGREAQATYRQYRDWTADALTKLDTCGALTADGQRFVAGMAQALADA